MRNGKGGPSRLAMKIHDRLHVYVKNFCSHGIETERRVRVGGLSGHDHSIWYFENQSSIT